MASTWMFVEDEPDLYEILSALFELWGHDVIAFQTGEEAAEWLASVERGEYKDALPEFALLDIRLPGQIDGIEVCKRLRKIDKFSRIPVIMATAYRLSPAQTDDIMAQTNADLLLHKPLPSVEEFHALVEKVFIEKQSQ